MELPTLRQRLLRLKMEMWWKLRIRMLYWKALVRLLSMINGLPLQYLANAPKPDMRYCDSISWNLVLSDSFSWFLFYPLNKVLLFSAWSSSCPRQDVYIWWKPQWALSWRHSCILKFCGFLPLQWFLVQIIFSWILICVLMQVLDLRSWTWSKIEAKSGPESQESQSHAASASCAGHSLVSLELNFSLLSIISENKILTKYNKLHHILTGVLLVITGYVSWLNLLCLCRYPGTTNFFQLLVILKILLKLSRVYVYIFIVPFRLYWVKLIFLGR